MSLFTAPHIRYVDVTPVVLNNDAYDAGDVVFDVTQIPNACSRVGQPTRLESLVIIDKDDQTAAVMTLFFFDSNISTFGTKDSAPSISDANALFCLGSYAMASASFLDVGGAKIATATNIGLILKPAAATADVYFAGITAGTPTQTTGGLVFRFGFRDV